jgi:hypothetical protein
VRDLRGLGSVKKNQIPISDVIKARFFKEFGESQITGWKTVHETRRFSERLKTLKSTVANQKLNTRIDHRPEP